MMVGSRTPPQRRYVDGKVSHFDYVDTDLFSAHDLNDMCVKLGFQKDNPLSFQYCMPDHSLDVGLLPIDNDGDVRKFLSYVPKHRELVVYICERPPLNVIHPPCIT